MTIVFTVTSNGQVTLRKDVLRHLNVRLGDKVSVELLSQNRIQMRASARQPVSSIFGLLARCNAEQLTTEQIAESSAAGWAGET